MGRFFALLLLFLACSSKEPWIGTYFLEVTEEHEESHSVYRSMGIDWPQIVLQKNGRFILKRPEGIGEGIYSVDGNRITLTLLVFLGERAAGELAEPRTVHSLNRYSTILMNGVEPVRFIRR